MPQTHELMSDHVLSHRCHNHDMSVSQYELRYYKFSVGVQNKAI